MATTIRFYGKVSWVIAAAVLVGGADLAFAFSSKRKAAAPDAVALRDPDPKTEQWLSTLKRQETLGIELEPAERIQFLKERARAFVEYARKRPSAKAEAPACDKDKDPFCAFMSDPEVLGLVAKRARHRGSRAHRHNVRAARGWLTKGNLDQLTTLPERDINDAIRTFSSFKPLEKASKQALEANDCKYSTLSFLLGTKAEEFLPDEAYRKKAIQLYGISARCGDTDADAKAGASYRYSLLQIWSDNCAAAIPYLKELSAPGQSKDYRARALFWSSQCHLQIKTDEAKEIAQKAKDALITEFPFSLHSLLLQGEDREKLKGLLSRSDSIARFRSQQKAALNAAVTAAEALISVQEIGYARRVLASIGSEADGAEPEFQIYLAWLFNEAGDPVNKFRTLTVAFRDYPSSISRAALELYYPRKKELRAEVIRKTGVNEFVVMALIRQESAFNERARSPAGALGLMQVMPRTARMVERGRKRPNLYDPNNNVRIGSKYFSFLLKQYDGDTELALAAYNAGPKRVEQWVKRYNVQQRVLFLDLIPFRETREYVASIARNYFWYSALYQEAAMAEGDSPQPAHVTQGVEDVFKLFGT